MKLPSDAANALTALGRLAQEAALPGSQVRRILSRGLADDSGLHPHSLAKLIDFFAQGYQPARLQRALQRASRGGQWQPLGDVAVVAPGNLPVAAWQAAIEPLLAGNRVRLRPSRAHAIAAENLRDALADCDLRVAERLQIVDFDHGDQRAWASLLDGCAALAVHGSDQTAVAVLAQAAASGWSGRLRIHGEMRSLALVDAEGLRKGGKGLLRRLADDALLGDGRGCMSLRTLVAVGLERPAWQALHGDLHAALVEAQQRWPVGSGDRQGATGRQLRRESLELQEILSNGALLFSPRDDGWLASSSDPQWLGEQWPGPGGRDLVLWAAADWPEMRRRWRPWRGRISTLAVAADLDQLRMFQDEMAVPRLCRPGQMQAPRADRSADGFAPLEGLVRYRDGLDG